MFKYDLSIILPSIRPQWLNQVYNSINAACNKYSFELIVISPYHLPDELQSLSNVKYIKDFGCPARCGQIGASLAEGELITWGSDDGLWQENSLNECIELLHSKTQKDGIIIRYSEGVNYSGRIPPDNYWKFWTHPDTQFECIPKDWNNCPVGMYYYNKFYELGGFDTRYEHLNMNCHQLAFLIQLEGGKFYQSPNLVINCNQFPNFEFDHRPIEEAYWNNDKDVFYNTFSNKEIYNIRDNIIFGRTKFDAWKLVDSIWKRRFK